jgi:hypothetical protein
MIAQARNSSLEDIPDIHDGYQSKSRLGGYNTRPEDEFAGVGNEHNMKKFKALSM